MRASLKVSTAGASVFVSLLLLGRPVAAQTPLAGQVTPTSSRSPAAYGTTNYTITTIAGLGFAPGSNGMVYNVSGSVARAVSSAGGHFYSALDIPAGSIIDYIGFNNLNDGTPGVMTIHLYARHANGTVNPLYSLGNTSHNSWATDSNSVPVGILWAGSGGGDATLILDMEIAASSSTQFFSSVVVSWRRTVSPAPASASFSDVPPSSLQFKFIEALHAAGITAGCGGGNYCPDSPITRGQMAVFLATALGLHWPD